MSERNSFMRGSFSDALQNAPIVSTLLDSEKDPMEVKRSAGWFGSYANLVNSIMGAGLLGLPYAFANTGWFFSILFIILSTVYSIIGLQLLYFCSSVTSQPSSFFSITKVVNKNSVLLVDFSVLCMTFGASVAYLIIIGDLMPKSLSALNLDGGGWDARERWVLIGFAFAAPLGCFHNLDGLKYTSGMCFAFLIFTTILVFVYSVPHSLDPCKDQMLDDDSIPCSGEQSVEPPSILDLLKVFSIFVFATACQTNVFPILSELEMPTDKRFFSLFTTSVSSASLSYLLFGACSYATYGDSVQSDAIVNYPANKVDSVARIFFSLVVAFSYPLQANPARRSAMSVLHVLFDGDEEPSLKSIRIRYFLVTAAFLSLSLALGLIFEDLGIVLGLVGATGSTTVMFILPGWHYLSLFHWNEGIKAKEGAETLASVGNVGHFQKVPSREPREDTEDELTAKLNQDDPSCNLEYLPVHQKSDVYVYLAWIQLVSGCIIMPVCLIALFL